MDMKGSIAAIKDAITKSTAERTSPEVISAAYAVVYLIGGVLLASARLLGGVGCRAERRCSPHRRSDRLHNQLRPCRQHTLSCRHRTCLHDKLCVSGHKVCVKKRVRACNGGRFRAVNRHTFKLYLGVHSGAGGCCRAHRNRILVRRLLVLP